MDDAPNSSQKFIGLVGPEGDPISQLLGGSIGSEKTDLVPIVDPIADGAEVNEIFVLSQDHALAHMHALVNCGKPCSLLLRRARSESEQNLWHQTLLWLADTLRRADWSMLNLFALTKAGAKQFSDILDRKVELLPQLGRLYHDRPLIEVSREQDIFEFEQFSAQGDVERRSAKLDVFNWDRLRRLAELRSKDAADLDMNDVVVFANGTKTSGAAAKARTPRLLAVVPNGVGLGHITRMMAVGKALQRQANADVIFWSYSRAAEILKEAGFGVILRQNIQHLDAHPPDWRTWETLEFASAIKTLKPDAVSYDGMNFDRFMIDAFLKPGCGGAAVVWVRRGMLQPNSDALLLEAEQFCDLVLEPGDLAVENDLGPTNLRHAINRGFSRKVVCNPVNLKAYLPPYSRFQAKRLLGLGPRRHCLVSLGGAFGNWDRLRAQIVEFAKKNKIRLVWAQSPLAAPSGDPSDGSLVRKFYPLSRYLSAFDGMISATGYNSFHELMLGYDGPVLFTPTNNDRLDDQVARATYAADQGWAYVVDASDPQDQSGVVEAFMSDVRQKKLVTSRPELPQGAEDMAREILKVCTQYREDR